jgi:hypothetical protein
VTDAEIDEIRARMEGYVRKIVVDLPPCACGLHCWRHVSTYMGLPVSLHYRCAGCHDLLEVEVPEVTESAAETTRPVQ